MLLTIAKIALAVGAVAGLIALDREWGLKRFNDTLNDEFGDVPNLDRNVLNTLHSGGK